LSSDSAIARRRSTRYISSGAIALASLLTVQAQSGDVRTWVGSHQRQIVNELLGLLAIPNVAADRPNIHRNAEHLRGMLSRRGFVADLLETDGNPLVYGELKAPGAQRTLLLYAHYDGQPVDPRAWTQPDPFTPVLRTGRIAAEGTRNPTDAGAQTVDVSRTATFDDDWRVYARSASDDKAPIVALCAAVDALRASGLSPTSNIRVILDGEEEDSSPSLTAAIGRYRDKLRADLMVILDGPIHSSGRPTVVFGARGIVTLDLTVFGPKAGVHSGNYGNWIPNPAQRLAALLASFKDDDGRVRVAGFYDGITRLSSDERALVDSVPDDSQRMLRTFGVAAPEAAFERLQDAFQYPTLNIRGLTSAHVGAGARTIIPDRATAALDVRLVKETRADDLLQKLRAHIAAQGFHLVDAEPDDAVRSEHSRIARLVVTGSTTNAFRTSSSDPIARRIVDALSRSFGAAPVRVRTAGGTVPIAQFIAALGFPAVLVPTVNFDNNQHEENENVRLGHLFQAVEIIAAVLRS
jgi:acetylornithine deacetylase/succinyl-diaminopimelate desuccinylase-like protein